MHQAIPLRRGERRRQPALHLRNPSLEGGQNLLSGLAQFQRLGAPEFDEADRDFARAIQKTVRQEDIVAAHRRFGLPVTEAPLCDRIAPLDAPPPPSVGSTDVGDVSWAVPTVQARGATYAVGTPGHSWQLTAQGKTPYAHKGMVHVAKVMAGTAVDVLRNPELLSQARADHQARLARTPYDCPLPAGMKPVFDMAEGAQAFERPVVERLLRRSYRDIAFRRKVRDAYDYRCAISGLRLRNGGGRPEVQAAHIRPVEHGGSDSVRNGLALSGTLHWMFDRGLISVAEDCSILVSRNKVPADVVDRLLLPGGKLIPPPDPTDAPHPENLRWHRENIFGQTAPGDVAW